MHQTFYHHVADKQTKSKHYSRTKTYVLIFRSVHQCVNFFYCENLNNVGNNTSYIKHISVYFQIDVIHNQIFYVSCKACCGVKRLNLKRLNLLRNTKKLQVVQSEKTTKNRILTIAKKTKVRIFVFTCLVKDTSTSLELT